MSDANASADDPGPFRPTGAQLLAHDIRSAVSDVIGGTRLIEREGLSEDHLIQIDRVQSAAELLARLVEALLEDMPRDSVGPVGNLNLRRFIDDELRRWHGASRGTGISVKLDRSGDLPEIVQLPLLPLRRIVANLMSNAMRHSGGAVVQLGTDMDEAGMLRISVQDDGCGLPDHVLRTDGETSGAPDPDGRIGMGLHIAQAHAAAIGAELHVGQSVLGGAMLELSVPREAWSRLPDPALDAALPDLRGHRVLVADDSATSRMMAQSMLARLGAECETARDGIEALNWLSRERFDLALIDVEMPVLSGLDVLRSERLRQARGIAPPTPLVAMTAYALRDARDAILQAGAAGILAKPLGKIESFAKAVAHFLASAPDPATWTPETATAVSTVMLAELMGAAGPEQGNDLLNRLREDLARVERDLSEALAGEDSPAVEAQTHILLSLSSAIGALPTQEAARRLNRAAALGTVARKEGEACLACLARLRAELELAV